jgi:hypothetical protein
MLRCQAFFLSLANAQFRRMPERYVSNRQPELGTKVDKFIACMRNK